MEFLRFRIEKIEQMLPDIKTFRLVPLEGTVPERKPGQFIVLKIGEDERSYSMSGCVDRPYLEVTVRLAGVFTHKLFELKEGDEILVGGPDGRFFFSEEKIEGSSVVFIAGGVGITPIACMMEYLARKNLPNKAVLIYGSRGPGEIILKERLSDIAGRSPNLKMVLAVDKLGEGEKWDGHVGFIDKRLIESSVESPKDAKYFLCGPPVMVKIMVAILKEIGVPLQNINMEGWG